MSFNTGDKVTFTPSRSFAPITAEVTGSVTSGEGKGRATFLVTKDAAGKERKVRPGACTLAA